MIASGNILKMKSTLADVVEYKLPIGDELLLMNQFLEKKISLSFLGNKLYSFRKKIKKTYGQGYSYESFMKLAACDMCIVKPNFVILIKALVVSRNGVKRTAFLHM